MRANFLGLSWRNVDLQRRRLTIAGTASRSLDGKQVVTAPKTAASPRTLALPGIAVEALSNTRRQGDLIWPHADGGPIPASSFTKRWRSMARRAGIRVVNFHALRHTAATLALEDGMPPHVVAAMLGHASVATTLRLYVHVTHASVQALADAIDARYGPRLRVSQPLMGTRIGTGIPKPHI